MALFLFTRSRCDGRESVQEVGDFVAHLGDRTKGLVSRIAREWFEIVQFNAPRFAHGHGPDMDITQLPPNTPQFLLATARRIEHSVLMNFGLKRVEVSKHIRNIIKKLAENADGTLKITSQMTSIETRILTVLTSIAVVEPAFDDESLFADFSALLMSHSLLQKSERSSFAKLKIPIGLFALAAMNQSKIIMNGADCHIGYRLDQNEKLCEAIGSVPMGSSVPGISWACPIFTVHADPIAHCTDRLINSPVTSAPLEINPEGKLDLLV